LHCVAVYVYTLWLYINCVAVYTLCGCIYIVWLYTLTRDKFLMTYRIIAQY
jgi:hypothetical protein